MARIKNQYSGGITPGSVAVAGTKGFFSRITQSNFFKRITQGAKKEQGQNAPVKSFIPPDPAYFR